MLVPSVKPIVACPPIEEVYWQVKTAYKRQKPGVNVRVEVLLVTSAVFILPSPKAF